jgi:signal transduction histidine kinase
VNPASVLADQVLVKNAYTVRERMLATMNSYHNYLLFMVFGFVLTSMILFWILRRQTRLRYEIELALDDAEQAHNAKTVFFANMSHELRSPLNAIIGMSEIMNKGMFGPMQNEKYQEYVGDIHMSGVHLHDLIGDILDLSAMEAGKTELNVEAFDILALSNETIRMMMPLAEKGGIQLWASVANNVPAVLADQRKMRQILLNLLSNAIKFTPEKGEVHLGVSIAESGELALSVRDTGIGMDSSELRNADEPFWQTARSYDKKHEGTGLGLAVTSGLLAAHGGRLELQSILGRGTTATALLPQDRLQAA